MSSEEIIKSIKEAVEVYCQDLEVTRKKQKEVLCGFIKRLEDRKISTIRKEIGI